MSEHGVDDSLLPGAGNHWVESGFSLPPCLRGQGGRDSLARYAGPAARTKPMASVGVVNIR